MEFNYFDHVFVFLIGIVIPFMSFKSGTMNTSSSLDLPPKKHIFYTNGLILIIGALLVITSWNISNKPWDVLGVRWPKLDNDIITLCCVLIALYFTDILYSYLFRKDSEDQTNDLYYIIPINWKEFSHYIFLAFAAGISEEIVFRGFLINYLVYVLPNTEWTQTLAIILPAIVFSISHFYQGPSAVLKIFFLSVLFAWIFILSGSLLIIVIMHIAIDLISGLLAVLSYSNDISKTQE